MTNDEARGLVAIFTGGCSASVPGKADSPVEAVYAPNTEIQELRGRMCRLERDVAVASSILTDMAADVRAAAKKGDAERMLNAVEQALENWPQGKRI